MKKKLVLTGGHAATTALAVIEKLSQEKIWEIYWIGAERAFEGKKTQTLEAMIFSELAVEFHPLIMGRLQRKWTRHTLLSLFKVPLGFVHSFFLLSKLKPDLVLSFGGFASFPVVFNAWLRRIPVIIHDQTAVIGLANKLSARFAKKIALSRKESQKFFPKKKSVLTGNPIMSNVLLVRSRTKIGSPPTLFIYCGSRGSQIINRVIEKSLDQLLSEYLLIHQTGELDFEKFKQLKKSLPQEQKDKYQVFKLIEPQEVGSVYQQADMVVSRAGANTVSEIMAVQRPSILIPIPWSRFDEQNQNAQLAQKAGIARIINQDHLTPENLFREIDQLKENYSQMVKDQDLTLVKLDRKAAQKIVSLIQETLKEN